MKVLYVSALVSQRKLQELYEANHRNPGFAVQKFHRLLTTGLVANGAKVKTLSAFPTSFASDKKIFFNLKSEKENGVGLHYAFFINLPVLRHICLFFVSFFSTFRWGVKDRKNKAVMCDVLNISVCMGALWASKIVGIKCVGVMTDMPGLMVGGQQKKLKNKVISSVNKSYLAGFSHYVFLTEQMNQVINRNNRPYIVMEGLVDVEMATSVAEHNKTPQKRIVMYAGGLHEKYGLKMLVDAFMQLPGTDIQLSLYGSGPMESYIKECASNDKRVVYYGVRPNDEIVAAELQATLLVNPRPTHEEFTKYSFPSKNMEYMVSGTPLLTTALLGMPKEYYPYVYLFGEETTSGYHSALKKTLSLSGAELAEKGCQAKGFVLKVKNNHMQAKRIIDLVK